MLISSPLIASGAWTEPPHWNEIGTVQEWMSDDSHFYRIEQLTGSLSRRFYGDDQQAAYRRTFDFDSDLQPLGLKAFSALPADQVEKRRAEAREVLEQVLGFHNRMADLVMRVRANQDVGWGLRDMDPRVVDDLLGRLQTATGLDPADPYAWHLLAYLATSCGDLPRGLAALDSLDAALAVLPRDQYDGMRRRARLDRAWLLRDLGRFADAAGVLGAEEAGVQPGLEIQVLRGLIAAQMGDMKEAKRLASKVDGAPLRVFQQDWESNSVFTPGILDPMVWPAQPSSYLKDWILALAWLHEGSTDMAARVFPSFSRMRHYYPFGSRFWNDAGAIYEATGRRDLADKAWGLALMYTPYFPYFTSKAYKLDLSDITGRPGDQPFFLAFDTNFIAGDRLTYGASLLARSRLATNWFEQADLAGQAVQELGICAGSGLNTAVANLLLGYAHAVQGDPQAMLAAGRRAQQALDRPGWDQTCRPAVDKLLQAAQAGLNDQVTDGGHLFQMMDLAWSPGEDPVVVEARLRAHYRDNPGDGAVRRDLARFLLRHGHQQEGMKLAREPLQADLTRMDPEDLKIILEADRLQNNAVRAEELLKLLDQGAGERWPDVGLWTLVGFICQDAGDPGGRRALEFALKLDPGNDGLRQYLAPTPLAPAGKSPE